MTRKTVIKNGYELYWRETNETIEFFTLSLGDTWRLAKEQALKGHQYCETIVIGRCQEECYVEQDGTCHDVYDYESFEPIKEINVVAVQNDVFRKRLWIPYFGIPDIQGRYVISKGVRSLAPQAQIEIFAMIRDEDEFHDDNCPSEHRNFGVVYHGNESIVWKIDYSDTNYRCNFGGYTDPKATRRVMTILLDEEYHP